MMRNANKKPASIAGHFAGLSARHFQQTTVSKAIYATGWDGDVDVTADTSGKLTVHTQ